MKPGRIVPSITVVNALGTDQTLAGSFKIPPHGELQVELAKLDDHRRVIVWKCIVNAVLGKALSIKGCDLPTFVAWHENPPSTV